MLEFDQILAGLAGEPIAPVSEQIAAVPPFLRVLLTSDGTVTKALEAYFWERVEVVNVHQSYLQLECDEPLLAKRVGQVLLKRSVELVGARSGTRYAFADSFINTDLLSQDLREGLEKGRIGIGEMVRGCGLETFREVVDLGWPGAPEEVDSAAGAELQHSDEIWRRYTIAQGGLPLMLIRETFPLSVYRGR